MTADLISRLESGSGADRELDCLIFCETAESPFAYYGDCIMAQQGGFAARVEIEDIPAFTSSLDAALSLVERMLPKCGVNIDIPADGRKNFGAHIGQSEDEWTYDGWPSVVGPSAPRVVLIALLTVLDIRAKSRALEDHP